METTTTAKETATNARESSPGPAVPVLKRAATDDDDDDAKKSAGATAVIMGPPPPPTAFRRRKKPNTKPGDVEADLFKRPAVPSAERSATPQPKASTSGAKTAVNMGPPLAPVAKIRRSNPCDESDEAVIHQQIMKNRVKRLARIKYLEDLVEQHEEELVSMRNQLEEFKNMDEFTNEPDL